MPMQYRTTGTLQLQRVMHPAGSIVPIADRAEAARLIALGAITAVSGPAHPAPSIFDASASTKTLVPQIKASTDAVALGALREAELNRPDGARATVIAAIDARLEGLTAEGADDEESDEGDE
jgi:hypothetical protein